MLFSLTNFKGEEVEESIKVGKEYIPFNLCNYMEAHKVRTIRLYLQSRKHNLVSQRKNYTKFSTVWQRKSTTHPYLNSTSLKVSYGKERKEH